MRVLYLYKDYYPILGGIENHVRLLAEGLHARGVETRVLVTNTENRTIREAIDGVPVVKTARQINISSAPVSLPFFPALRNLERGVDIAHAHMPYPPGELGQLLLGRSRRFVVTYHSDIVRQRVLGALYRPFLWQVLRRADLIAVSNPVYIQDSPFLRRYAAKCRVIHFGIELDRFTTAPEIDAAAAQWRSRFNDAPLLLFVGRLRHYKGVNVLIEAMAALGETRARALVVGVGPSPKPGRRRRGPWGLPSALSSSANCPMQRCGRSTRPLTFSSYPQQIAPKPLALSNWRPWRTVCR
ncbi:MAG: glycosyltransferase [Anaerolineales bacterium]|nr:glycosyltransferase [Anaerolineales bacterium]